VLLLFANLLFEFDTFDRRLIFCDLNDKFVLNFPINFKLCLCSFKSHPKLLILVNILLAYFLVLGYRLVHISFFNLINLDTQVVIQSQSVYIRFKPIQLHWFLKIVDSIVLRQWYLWFLNTEFSVQYLSLLHDCVLLIHHLLVGCLHGFLLGDNTLSIVQKLQTNSSHFIIKGLRQLLAFFCQKFSCK
jgi:hypothetical protein